MAQLFLIAFRNILQNRKRSLLLGGAIAGVTGLLTFTPYYFWRGINPAAMVALAAGCATYVTFLNPLSFASAPLYPFLTASLPAAGAAAAVHFLGTLILVRAGRGGYSHGQAAGQ